MCRLHTLLIYSLCDRDLYRDRFRHNLADQQRWQTRKLVTVLSPASAAPDVRVRSAKRSASVEKNVSAAPAAVALKAVRAKMTARVKLTARRNAWVKNVSAVTPANVGPAVSVPPARKPANAQARAPVAPGVPAWNRASVQTPARASNVHTTAGSNTTGLTKHHLISACVGLWTS